ncbi:Druantia anti-phage system protein DruA [Alistipes indistinctus]|jgi:hypothetical protein|uniref:Druantia anti-phage system protein DruA n=1 Tax=Alistipes indistinctus TaxID=626932 RepID=UPI00242C4577|nr:Druantia anti-phage system protein DruA [Alistipes indistinctus]
MEAIRLKIDHSIINRTEDIPGISSDCLSQENKVKLLIIRDLIKLNWAVSFNGDKIEIAPPQEYSKETIKETMSFKRKEIIDQNRTWINNHISLARQNLAQGKDVLNSNIEPVIEVCETQKQHDLFRIFRYYWSSPYSDYVGRRIKLIIRDKGLPNKPIIGIAALGSPIIHIPERDEFIGWDKDLRTQNLIYTMDAYVIGALPPYNLLLGGKLISMLLASKEVRKIYEKKYKDRITIIDQKVSNKLVGIFTTSLYGKSSQYNRLKYKDTLLYEPIGHTKGFGTLHLSKETIQEMVRLLKMHNKVISHSFGDGPSWVMRIIRASGDLLGFDPKILLNHSFKRGIYFAPLAKNYKEILNNQEKKIDYYNYSSNELTNFWKDRWLKNRKKNLSIISEIYNFNPECFEI